MAEENRIIDKIVGADGNANRFHAGRHPQGGIPLDLNEAEEQSLEIHKASIHAPDPRPRWGTDEEGNPVEVSPAGLIVTDPLTGAVEPLTDESLAKSEQMIEQRAAEDEARRSLRFATAPSTGTSQRAEAATPGREERQSERQSERTQRRGAD